jgi:hypothetical protein
VSVNCNTGIFFTVAARTYGSLGNGKRLDKT